MRVSDKIGAGWLILGLAVSVGVAGCGDDKSKLEAARKKAEADYASRQAASDIHKYSYSDGVDICFKKVKEKLGELAMVNTIDSSFDAKRQDGKERPAPALSQCDVKYQDSQNPQKLLSMKMDTHTGEFKAPRPIELDIIGGDPEKFKLESILIPLKSVNASMVAAILEKNKPLLDAKLSEYSVYFLNLRGPGMLKVEREHSLVLNIAGKYKSNGTKASIGINISANGKQVLSNGLSKE